MHKHLCSKCRKVWEHEDHCIGSRLAHTCPTLGCEKTEYWPYQGGIAPTFLQSCLPNPSDGGERLVNTVILLSFSDQK